MGVILSYLTVTLYTTKVITAASRVLTYKNGNGMQSSDYVYNFERSGMCVGYFIGYCRR
jgi:hypothetical protein